MTIAWPEELQPARVERLRVGDRGEGEAADARAEGDEADEAGLSGGGERAEQRAAAVAGARRGPQRLLVAGPELRALRAQHGPADEAPAVDLAALLLVDRVDDGRLQEARGPVLEGCRRSPPGDGELPARGGDGVALGGLGDRDGGRRAGGARARTRRGRGGPCSCSRGGRTWRRPPLTWPTARFRRSGRPVTTVSSESFACAQWPAVTTWRGPTSEPEQMNRSWKRIAAANGVAAGSAAPPPRIRGAAVLDAGAASPATSVAVAAIVSATRLLRVLIDPCRPMASSKVAPGRLPHACVWLSSPGCRAPGAALFL